MEENLKKSLENIQREMLKFPNRNAAYYFGVGYKEGFSDGTRNGVKFAEDIVRKLISEMTQPEEEKEAPEGEVK